MIPFATKYLTRTVTDNPKRPVMTPGRRWRCRLMAFFLILGGLAFAIQIWNSPHLKHGQRAITITLYPIIGVIVFIDIWLRSRDPVIDPEGVHTTVLNSPPSGGERIGWGEALFEWFLVGGSVLSAIGMWWMMLNSPVDH